MLGIPILFGLLVGSVVASAPAGDAPTPGPDDLVLGSTEWVSVFSPRGNLLKHFADSCPQQYWRAPALDCSWALADDAAVLVCVAVGGNGGFGEAQFASD